MRRPGFTINEHVELPRMGVLLPDELASARERVGAWGGDTLLFHQLVAPLLTIAPAHLRDASAVAAWRAGVVRMRDAALEIIPQLPAEVAASALALEPHELPAFLDAQHTSRYAHPRLTGEVARLGGFVGLGGRLRTRATYTRFVHNGIAFRTGDTGFHVELDVFGEAWTGIELSPAVAGSDGFPAELAEVPGNGYRVFAPFSSYLITVGRAA